MINTLVSIGLIIAYALLAISIILGILMPILNFVRNPGTLSKGLYGILFLAVVFGLAFAFSHGDQSPLYAREGYGPMASKIIGAGLISIYILMIISVLILVGSEILKLFK